MSIPLAAAVATLLATSHSLVELIIRLSSVVGVPEPQQVVLAQVEVLEQVCRLLLVTHQ